MTRSAYLSTWDRHCTASRFHDIPFFARWGRRVLRSVPAWEQKPICSYSRSVGAAAKSKWSRSDLRWVQKEPFLTAIPADAQLGRSA